MGKSLTISSTNLTPNLVLRERRPDSVRPFISWWAWDRRARSNIAIGAGTRDQALAEAVDYWANKAIRLERKLSELEEQIRGFVENVGPSVFADDNE